jgi:uncharacterized membrane protein YuzA (DUF378 family)
MAIVDNKMLEIVAALLAAAGAINWALIEFMDTNLLTDTLSLAEGTQNYSIVVLAIGAAGVLQLYVSYYWFMEG